MCVFYVCAFNSELLIQNYKLKGREREREREREK